MSSRRPALGDITMSGSNGPQRFHLLCIQVVSAAFNIHAHILIKSHEIVNNEFSIFMKLPIDKLMRIVYNINMNDKQTGNEEKEMTRTDWSTVATKRVSAIVGGDVDVNMIGNEIVIYAENYDLGQSAVSYFVAAGSDLTDEMHYLADEDMPEGWAFSLSIPN